MTSDLHTIVLLSCSLNLWLSYQRSVLRLWLRQIQKQANNTSSQHQQSQSFLIPEKKPFFSAARDTWLERKDRNTRKFLKTEGKPLEMHLIIQKNTHTSFSTDFSQGSARFNFWQEWKWGCDGLKYSAFNGFYCCLTTNRLLSWWNIFMKKPSVDKTP